MKLNETDDILASEKLKSKTLMGVIGEARKIAYDAVCDLNKLISTVSFDPTEMKKDIRLVDNGREIAVKDHRNGVHMYFNLGELEYLEHVLKILREARVRE